MKKGDKFLIKGNRYHERNYLVFNREKEGKYYFHIETEYDMFRIIYNEDNKTIYAIDPSGGPFMAVGDKIPIDLDRNILEIKSGGIIVC